MINVNSLIIIVFLACLSGSTHAWRTYFVPISGHCWRIRLTPNATLVGWQGDPNCDYFPDGIDSAPDGFKPEPQRIAKMDYQDGNTYYFKPTLVFPQKAWSGNITTVMDVQYANTRGVLVPNAKYVVDYVDKVFEITIGIPPAPTESPSVFASSSPSNFPIVIPANIPVAFKTVHNSYYRAGGERFGYLINQAREVKGWEKFTIISVDDGNGGYHYVIQTHRGSFIKANVGGTGATITQDTVIDDTTKFIIRSALTGGDGKVVIETLHGTFFRAVAGRIDQTEDFYEPSTKIAIIEC